MATAFIIALIPAISHSICTDMSCRILRFQGGARRCAKVMQCQSSAFGGGGERVRFLHSGSPVQRFQKEEAFQVVTARTAIIDIGSNSVRLVVYDGPRRIPFTLFNEQVDRKSTRLNSSH